MTLRPLATALILAYSGTTLAQNDPFIVEILNKNYPANNFEATDMYRMKLGNDGVKGADKAVCHLREPTAEETTREDEHRINEGAQFCMRFHSEKIIDTTAGKRRYLLFIGDDPTGGHAYGGLVDFMIFNAAGDSWTLAHQGAYEIGAWGEAPTEWQWLEFAPQRWGVQGESGFSQMGYSSTAYNLIREDGDQIRYQFIHAGSSNTASRDCDEEPKKQRKACRESLYSLESAFKLRPDLGAENGAYPIEIQVSGEVGTKKRYKNESYIFKYNPKEQQYVVPADYPIEGI